MTTVFGMQWQFCILYLRQSSFHDSLMISSKKKHHDLFLIPLRKGVDKIISNIGWFVDKYQHHTIFGMNPLEVPQYCYGSINHVTLLQASSET